MTSQPPFQASTGTGNSQFFTLFASRNGLQPIPALVSAANRHRPALSSSAQRALRIQTALEHAERDVENLVEVFLTHVPNVVTAHQLAGILEASFHRASDLRNSQSSRLWGRGSQALHPAVLKCDIHNARNLAAATAHATVRNEYVARVLIEKSPIDVAGHAVIVREHHVQNRVTVGGRRRYPLDAGRGMWKVGQLQVGEDIADDLFSCFWSVTDEVNWNEGTYVELRPLDRVLRVTFGRQMFVFRVGSEPDKFERVLSRVRVEIPFHFLTGDPKLEESGKQLAVHLSVSKPPLLFRVDKVCNRVVNNLKWSFNDNDDDRCRWIRTVDPTPNHAFSRCTGIRLLLKPNEIFSFWKALHKFSLVSAETQRPNRVLVREDRKEPNREQVFRRAATYYCASFPVRYGVDRILSEHRLPISFVTPEFWETISKRLSEEDALIVLDCMSFLLKEKNVPRISTYLSALLERCRMLCNVVLKNPSASSPVNLYPISNVEDENLFADKSRGAARGIPGSTPNDGFIREMKLEGLKIENDAQIDRNSFPAMENSKALDKVRRSATQRAYVRRILYTPTRTVVLKPENDLLNRVLRAFSEFSERFIRVSFCDEDYNPVGFTGSDDLFTRVRLALRDGIECAGEIFQFLAFSNSQLRDGAVWMYNETPNGDTVGKPPTTNEIRAWMGDFSGIKIPAKFAARQGQAFSSTVGAVVLDAVQETEITDIYDKNGSYAFSDGIGIMSSGLAHKVCEKLDVNSSGKMPSAFQVRYGGAKGILTVWDAAMPAGNSAAEIALRPSMKKFGCKHRVLEIVGVARRLPMFLNRQIIMILSGLGVPDEPFEDMQQKLLEGLDRAMESNGKHAALDVLFSSGFCDYDIKLSRSVPPAMNPSAFFKAGLTCTNCEHLYNMMCAFRRRTIKDVIGRARIPVDWTKGVSAVGVMDELGVLTPGQVFCQFTQPTTKRLAIVKGTVTVGRYPCHHPGDIQPLNAVDEPRLHHLVDVIVFPRTGWRPIASMLSGGDLDGDIYFCIFDERIAFPPFGPYSPMNYESPKPVELDREVRTKDVANFFVDYMREDRLGQIASAHMLHADREAEGIFSKKCLRLAELHSVAVDFAKTGIPAQMPREVRRGRPLKYPDFMGKGERNSYESQKVLGKLYRACRATHPEGETEAFQVNASSRWMDDVIAGLADGQKYMAEADVLCDAYNVELIRLMDFYGVKTEGEVMSGQVVSFTANHGQLRARREYTSLLTRMMFDSNQLQRQFRELFFRDVNPWNGVEMENECMGKACAWFAACKKRAEVARRRGEVPLVSFPWVVADILLPVIEQRRWRLESEKRK